MKYLTLAGNRRVKGYFDLKEKIGGYSQVEICVYYSLGGINYFSGNTNPRGYKVSFTPVSVSNGMVSCTLLGTSRESGGFVSAEYSARYNAKRLAQIAELIDPKVPDIVAAFEADDKTRLIALCRVGNTGSAPSAPSTPTFQKSNMQILTKEIKEKLPPLYYYDKRGNEGTPPEDTPIAVKFFDPTGSWSWYATEGEKTGEIIKEGAFKGEEDYKFFGYVKGFEGELGYWTLGELSTAKGLVKGLQALPIERDRNFKGTLAEVMKN